MKSRNQRLSCMLSAAAVLIYVLVTAAVALTVTFCYADTVFRYKAKASPVLLARGVPCAFAAAALLFFVWLCRRERLSERRGPALLAFGSVLLFAWQMLVLYHASFRGRGDDVYYILNSAMAFGRGETKFIENAYLELCPNNISITGLYGLLLRGFMAVTHTEPGLTRLRLLLCFMQSVINVTTCLLTAAAAKRLTGSRHLAALVWLLTVLLVGLSPRFLIPYSDSTALLFPILMLLLWLRIRETGSVTLAALLGLTAGFTYIIKPHSMIPALAALIIAVLHPLGSRPARLARLLAGTACCLLIMFPVNSALHSAMDLRIDKEAGLNAAHYFNMGLNTEHDGCFLSKDRAFARSFPTRAERTRGCLQQAGQRILAMGPAGMRDHLIKKCLVNNADGTFGWNLDFSRVNLPEKNGLTPVIRSIVYDDGELHKGLATAQQIAWQLVLMLMPFAALAWRRADGERKCAILMLMLCCLGILLCNMLMEAKARYIFTIVPYFCLLSVMTGASLLSTGAQRGA